eukprot:COSAG02_NODE_653_length_18827_cov_44.237826_2_plen_83_part_00
MADYSESKLEMVSESQSDGAAARSQHCRGHQEARAVAYQCDVPRGGERQWGSSAAPTHTMLSLPPPRTAVDALDVRGKRKHR